MKKNYFFILVLLCVSLNACHNMCNEMEDALGSVCWLDNLKWEDVSDRSYDLSSTNYFAMGTAENEKNIIKAKYKVDGNNWLFSSLGRDIKGCEVQVKFSEGIKKCGIQLFANYGYQGYFIYLTNAGGVEVRYNRGKNGDKDVILLKKENVFSDFSQYQTIKLEIQKDRSVKVFINGNYVYSCTKDYQVKFGALAIAGIGNGTDEAQYKILKIQH